MVFKSKNFKTCSKKINGVNILEFRYPIAKSDFFYQFLNWLEGEFDLYQQVQKSDKLTIYYPQVKCTVQKSTLKNKLHARVIIVSKTGNLCDRFGEKISDIYNLLDSRYSITK